MISVTHPLLAGFRATFAAGPADEADVSACVDQLQELDATLADVLLLFAARPREWLAETWSEDERWRAVLAKWCEVTEPEKWLPTHPELEMGAFRFEAVRACVVVPTELDVTNFPGVFMEGVKGIIDNTARREHKRRVLALFPDVILQPRCSLSWDAYPLPPTLDPLLADFFLANGFRLDLDNGGAGKAPIRRVDDPAGRCWVYDQTIGMLDWIEDEDRMAIRAAYRDLINPAAASSAPAPSVR